MNLMRPYSIHIQKLFLVIGFVCLNCTDDNSFRIPINPGPDRPTGFSATASSATEVQLAWAGATDNTSDIGGIQGYRIIRDGVYLTFVVSINYIDTGLTPNTTYTYAVQWMDGNGVRSERSDEVMVTTRPVVGDTEPPAKPSDVIPNESGETAIRITWVPATDNQAINQYIIRRNGAIIDSVAGGQTEYEHVGVTPGIGYTYTIEAEDATGNRSGESDPSVLIATGPPLTPVAPDGVGVSPSSIYLSWSSVSDNANGSGVMAYQVIRNGLIIATVVETTYTEKDLLPSTQYTYMITAIDKGLQKSPLSPGSAVMTLHTNSNPGLDAEGNPEHALSFSVVAGSEIFNIGSSHVSQQVGIASSGSTFPDGISIFSGQPPHIGDPSAQEANRSGGRIRANILAMQRDTLNPDVSVDTIIHPGVTAFTGPTTIAGDITLDAHGHKEALFILRVTGTLTINANVKLAGGASADHVYIQSTGNINIGAGLEVSGNLLATASAQLGHGVMIMGRIFSLGVVFLNNTTILKE